jgi:hypothetical protein
MRTEEPCASCPNRFKCDEFITQKCEIYKTYIEEHSEEQIIEETEDVEQEEN